MRVFTHELVVKLVGRNAHSQSFIFLGHNVFLDHLVQGAVVHTISLSRSEVVVALRSSVLQILLFLRLKVLIGNLFSIHNRDIKLTVPSLTLEKVL